MTNLYPVSKVVSAVMILLIMTLTVCMQVSGKICSSEVMLFEEPSINLTLIEEIVEEKQNVSARSPKIYIPLDASDRGLFIPINSIQRFCAEPGHPPPKMYA